MVAPPDPVFAQRELLHEDQWYRVDSVCTPGVTTGNPVSGEKASADQAVQFQCTEGIGGTGRVMAASGRSQR